MQPAAQTRQLNATVSAPLRPAPARPRQGSARRLAARAQVFDCERCSSRLPLGQDECSHCWADAPFYNRTFFWYGAALYAVVVTSGVLILLA